MRLLIAVIMMALAGVAQAEVKTRQIDYQSADGTRLIGYYAWDDAIKGPRPGVIVVHEWWGLNDYAKRRARDLAALGYSRSEERRVGKEGRSRWSQYHEKKNEERE